MAPKRRRTVPRRPTSKESSFTDCPACEMKVVSSLINHHLDWDCPTLIRNKRQLPLKLAAEIKERPLKNPRLCNEKPHYGCPDVKDFEVRAQEKISILDTEAKLYASSVQDSVSILDSVLHVKEKQAELDVCCDGDKLVAGMDEGLGTFHADVDCGGQDLRRSDAGLQADVVSILDSGLHHVKENQAELGVCHDGDRLVAGMDEGLDALHAEVDFGGQDVCRYDAGLRGSTSIGKTDSDGQYGIMDDCRCLEIQRFSRLDGKSSCNAHLLCEARDRSSAEASTSGPESARGEGWLFITTSLPSKIPKGHYVLENFISEKEEQDILCFLDTDLKNPWRLNTFNGLHLGKAYGLSTNLRKRCVCPAIFEIPKVVVPVLERMRTTISVLRGFCPNETNAIDYYKHKGHWLKPHVDDRQLSGTILVNLSLCGDCRMTYERERGPHELYKVLLRRRCIQILTGESRYSFTHSIMNKDLLDPRRVSMTFRQSSNP